MTQGEQSEYELKYEYHIKSRELYEEILRKGMSVHAAFTFREVGLDSVMVNCNPEMVFTGYDTSDKLYFEPLTVEDVYIAAVMDI